MQTEIHIAPGRAGYVIVSSWFWEMSEQSIVPTCWKHRLLSCQDIDKRRSSWGENALGRRGILWCKLDVHLHDKTHKLVTNWVESNVCNELYSWIQNNFKFSFKFYNRHPTCFSAVAVSQSLSEALRFREKEISQSQSKYDSDVQQLTYSFASLSWPGSVITHTLSYKLANWPFLFGFLKIDCEVTGEELQESLRIKSPYPSHKSFFLWLSLQLKKLKGSGAFTLRVEQLSGFLWFSFKDGGNRQWNVRAWFSARGRRRRLCTDFSCSDFQQIKRHLRIKYRGKSRNCRPSKDDTIPMASCLKWLRVQIKRTNVFGKWYLLQISDCWKCVSCA